MSNLTLRSRVDRFSSLLACFSLAIALLFSAILRAEDVQVSTTRPVLATADFDLVGFAVDVEPAGQQVPKHTATGILTRMATPDGQPLAGGPTYDTRYKVRGELVGPSLTSPLTLETEIGQPLSIPPLSLAGDHLVINLRVVDTASPGEPVVGEVKPDTCSITVLDQLLVSQVSVKEMTYDEIAQSGIQVGQDSYSYYNFILTLGTLSQGQRIEIPVALPTISGVDPRPIVGTPGAPVGSSVPRPDVLPILLKPVLPEGSDFPESEAAEITLPGLIIFPGRIALLHQFFEAIVIVTNGAPDHTPLVVRALRARVVLPQAPNPADNPLRVAELQVGGAVEELELHRLGADGVYGTSDDSPEFAPAESAQASFLLEGLKDGLHTVKFELAGTLEGLAIGPVPVTGEAYGAVLVRDAEFGVTFTHPGTVRAGQEYDLAMTLFNSGSRDILGAFAELSVDSISGADLVGDGPEAERDFPSTITPGKSGTVKWRLRARVTGAVTASYVKAEGASALGLELVTGVGDRNVPLSPESLILPDPVKYLPLPVVEASSALLGQAWSVAVAPSGSLPAGVTSISRAVVLDRAVELGVAGLRVRFGEPLEVSLVTLARDWMGELQEAIDPGFDEVLCGTETGFDWQDEIGAEIATSLAAGAPAEFHERLAENELARSRFLSALVVQAEAAPLVDARLVDPEGNAAGLSTQGRSGAVSGAVALSLGAGSASRGAFLLASQPASGAWRLELETLRSGSVSVSLLLPIDDDIYRRIFFPALTVEQGAIYRVTFNPYVSSTASVERCAGGCVSLPASPTVDEIQEPAPRLEGIVQVSPSILEAGDPFGRLIAMLFSKPMDATKGENAANYTIGGGTLVGSNPPLQVGAPIAVSGVRLNFGNRFAFIGLAAPVGPFIGRTITATAIPDQRGLVLSPAAVEVPIEMTVSPGGAPPGGYLTGRVLEADGSAVSGAQVILWHWPCQAALPIALAEVASAADGAYSFDYVVNGECSPVIVTATHPATSAEKRLSTPVAYHGHHLAIDLIFLGRGSVRGSVTYLGQPVAGGYVQILPTEDPAGGALVRSDGAGQYFASGISVGPFSVMAVGAGELSNATGFASGSIDAVNQTATVNVTLQNTSGSIEGHLFQPDGKPAGGQLVVARAILPGIDDPISVGYCYTESDGAFALNHLPLASVTVVATDYLTRVEVQQAVQLTPQTPAVSGVVLTLPGYGAISGRVTNQAGYYVAGAEVRCGSVEVSSDMLGYYRIPAAPAGLRTVTAKSPESGLTASRAVTVVAGQDVTDFDLVIPDAARIRGLISVVRAPGQPATPLAGARVSYDGHVISTSNAQGAYLLDSVPPERSFILRVVDSTGRLAFNQQVRLNIGETLVRNFAFHPATLAGKVFQPDGETGAVARLLVYVPQPTLKEGDLFGLLSAEKPITTTSAGDGAYEVHNLNPAGFRVTAYNDFFPTRVSRLGVLPPDGVVTCDLVLADTLAGKIQGTVFQPDGVTPVGADVTVTLGGGALADATVKTDETGHYSFAEVFPSGNYDLTALDPETGFTNRVRISAERNQDTLADIRLLGRGAIQALVVDAAGAPVESGVVRLEGVDYPNATAVAELFAGSGGAVLFENMPEGAYAVVASRENLSGRESAVIPLNQTVSATVRLRACGTVGGQVFMPDGLTPVGLAEVRLVIDGRTVGFTTSSADQGAFSFASVPAGDFKLEAFDNRSTRLGRTAGAVSEQGEEVTANVTLTAIGTVRGQVTSNSAPVDHALVTIKAGELGYSYTSLKATTDADGNYSFGGVPVGKFRVAATHPVSRLTGSAEDSLSGTTEPLPDKIVNIALESSASIEGQVLDHFGVAVGGAQIAVTVGSRSFQAASREDGSFRVDFLPLGEAYVRAAAPTGNDRGLAGPIVLDEPGETQPVEVRLNGVGVVKGDAFDSDGVTPLTLGTVTLTNAEWPTPLVISVSVRDGKYEIQGAPAGEFSVKLAVPGRTAAGGATGVLSADQTLVLPLVLEPAGGVTGSVVKSDGVTPAVGADVTAKVTRQSGETLTLIAHTNGAGVYRFDQVPLGTINLSVDDPDSDAIAVAKGLVLSTNGQILNVPPLVLDDQPITVRSVDPAAGAINVPTDPVITITFSEPADPATVTASTINLIGKYGSVGISVTLSADGRVSTITPLSQLQDSEVYTIKVWTGVKDLAGWALPAVFRSSFTTRDETPPVVSSVDPAPNATGVAVDKLITVTFNEALDPQQSFNAGVIKLFPQDEPQALVPLSCELDATGLVVTALPTTPLEDSTRYRLEVTGQRDVSGNVQSSLYYSTFSTVDLTPPTVASVSVESQTLSTVTPEIVVQYSDDFSGIDTTSLVLELDGQDIRSGAQITTSQATYQVPETAPLTRGPHSIDVRISDQAGNQSQLRHAEFRVDDAPPQILSFTLAGQPIFDGMTITVFRPLFRATYSDASGIDITQTRLRLGPEAGPLAEAAATVGSSELTYLPEADLSQGVLVAELIVVDSLGNASSSGAVRFLVDVDAPAVIDVAPLSGSQHGGTTLVLQGERLFQPDGSAPVITIGGNPVTILSTQPGAPDVITILTPAGVPGIALIAIETERGLGTAPFIYEADPQTPFAVESDTLLLWHFDEPYNGASAITDSGPLGLSATSSAASQAAVGRFGLARSGHVSSSTNEPLLSMGSSSFTLEFWVKTGPVPRTYILAGKQRTTTGHYGAVITPAGALRAYLVDSGYRAWQAETSPLSTVVDDNLWHYVAMVVDRETGILSLYVDGVPSASSPQPAGFDGLADVAALHAGFYYSGDSTPGPQDFPGLLDEARLSLTAHSAARIEEIALGANGPLGVEITSLTPDRLIRGRRHDIRVYGYNLAGVGAQLIDPSGVALAAEVTGSSATEAWIRVDVPAEGSLGQAELRLTSSRGTVSAAMPVLDPAKSAPALADDSLLLLRMDEADGATALEDSGPFSLPAGSVAPATPTAYEGFSGKARAASVEAGPDYGVLDFTEESFTVEGWVKADRNQTVSIWLHDSSNFYPWRLEITAAGAVQAKVRDIASTTVTATAPLFVDLPTGGVAIRPLDDGQWHHLAMVFDRPGATLRLYVDGVLSGAAAVPPSFGALYSSASGGFGLDISSSGADRAAVLIDELRISDGAHSDAKIFEDYSGVHAFGVTSVAPLSVHDQTPLDRGIPVSLTINGYDLATADVQVRRDGAPLDVSVAVSVRSYGQLSLILTVPSTIPLGLAELVLVSPDYGEVATSVEIIDSRPLHIEQDTVALLRFDEPENGVILLQDESGFGLRAQSYNGSTSVQGRFGLARRSAFSAASSDLGSLDFGSHSFTAEAWVKLASANLPTRVILGRGNNYGENNLDWGLILLRSGGLRALFRDTSNALFQFDVEPLRNEPGGVRKMALVDDRWHFLSLVLNRESGQVEIYVDGALQEAAAIPAGFGAIRSPSNAALYLGLVRGSTVGPLDGVLDETRLSVTAHTPAEIWQDFSAIGPSRVSRVSPTLVNRDRTQVSSTEVSVEGFRLQGLTAEIRRDGLQLTGASAQIVETADGQARLTVSVAPEVSLGNAELSLVTQDSSVFSIPFQVVQPGPLPRQADTAVLWRMESEQNGAVSLEDSGPFRITGTTDADSTADLGRFGWGRRRAAITGNADSGAAEMGLSSFTLECWMKSDFIGRSYILAGRSGANGTNPKYGLTLLPSGIVQAWANDTATRNWTVEARPVALAEDGAFALKPLLDDQWHLVSMVVDKTAGLMTVYVDGEARGSAPAPADFAAIPVGELFRSGYVPVAYESGGFGPVEFPGVIDDVRLSTSAHDAGKMAERFIGAQAPEVTAVVPASLARGSLAASLTLHGLGLGGVAVQSETPSVGVTVSATTASQVDLLVTIPADTPAGPVRLLVTDAVGATDYAEFMVTAPQPFANPSTTDYDALALWHLDDERSGAVTLAGSGDDIPTPVGATSAAASLPVADGRFGYGRAKANLVATAGFDGYEPGASSFAVECWVRTPPVTRAYTLVGRSDADGLNPESSLTLLLSGALQAAVWDAANLVWQVEAPPARYDQATGSWRYCLIQDGQWHLVSMVVDRTEEQLRLYLDGDLVASGAAPAGFSTLRNLNKRVRAGHRNTRITGGTGTIEFPGDLDEIRVLAGLRTAEEIRADFGWPAADPAPPSGLRIAIEDQSVESRPAGLAAARAGGSQDDEPFQNLETDAGETLLLWPLDEPLNGAVRVKGAGDAVPEVIGGMAGPDSVAEAGRFAGGRASAAIVADADGGALDFGLSSFTLEFWLRTDQVSSTYTLVGRDGPQGKSKDFGVSLLPSGRLRAWVFDEAGLEWAAESDVRADDSAWRLVGLVVDRKAGALKLTINGQAIVEASAPEGFGAIRNQGERLRAGHIDLYGPLVFIGPEAFPGVLDDVRIVKTGEAGPVGRQGKGTED